MTRARQLAYPAGAEEQTDCAVPLNGTCPPWLPDAPEPLDVVAPAGAGSAARNPMVAAATPPRSPLKREFLVTHPRFIRMKGLTLAIQRPRWVDTLGPRRANHHSE